MADPIRTYYILGYNDALDVDRKRKRVVPQNFKLAYVSGWFDAKLKKASKYD